jgi:boron transporter
LWSNVPVARLAVPAAFATTTGRSWVVFDQLNSLPVGYCFAAIIPAIVLTGLVFFDNNVSSLLAQQEQFGLKKPSSYNLDFAVLGIITIVCAFFGVPIPNGLIPQAPLHNLSLATIKNVQISPTHTKEVYESVLETRLSNFLHGALICLSGVFVWIFGLIPSAVLIGFFLYLGYSGLLDFQFGDRLKMMITQTKKRRPAAYLRAPFRVVFGYTAIQFVCTAIIFGVTLTPAAVAFPVFIVALVPLRFFGLPKIFSQESLDMLDGTDTDAAVIGTGAALGEHPSEEPISRADERGDSESSTASMLHSDEDKLS